MPNSEKEHPGPIHHNQHTARVRRNHRLPLLATTHEERIAVERIVRKWNVTMGQLQRIALAELGVFDRDSLADFDPEWLEKFLEGMKELRKGKKS